MTDSDEFVGRISFVSLFPQYLQETIVAMLFSLNDCTFLKQAQLDHSLDTRNVHGRRGGSLVDHD